jgi:hypothetical protein
VGRERDEEDERVRLGATVACLTVANLAAAQGPVPSASDRRDVRDSEQGGITDVYASAIVGDVGTGVTGAALLLTCGEVSGKIYTVDAAGPLLRGD